MHSLEACTNEDGDEADAAWRRATLVASQLAETATAGRHYVKPLAPPPAPPPAAADGTAPATPAAGNIPPGSVQLDPRFLVFEFVHDLLLRKAQASPRIRPHLTHHLPGLTPTLWYPLISNQIR